MCIASLDQNENKRNSKRGVNKLCPCAVGVFTSTTPPQNGTRIFNLLKTILIEKHLYYDMKMCEKLIFHHPFLVNIK